MTETNHETPDGTLPVVYVRRVDPAELKADGVMPLDADVPAHVKLYAVHLSNGQRIAVLDSRDGAFAAARQNDLDPVSVH